MSDSNNLRVSEMPERELSQHKKVGGRRNEPRRSLVVLLIAVVILIVALLGTGYWYHANHDTKKTKKNSTSQIVSAASTGSSSLINYTSNGSDLNLTFTYPSTWSVNPPSNDNSSDQTITITSPLNSITNATNSSVTGKVVVMIRPGSDTINELNSNNPIVAITSTQIAYSQPTSDQYQYPYLTYLHFSNGSTASGAFEEVIISGSQSFNQGEAIAAGYLSGLDPIISASFYQCKTQACAGAGEVPLSITDGTWQNATIFQQVLNLFQSMQLN